MMNCVATRKVTIGGVKYLPGDPVNVSQMADHKVGQLLNLRILSPLPYSAVPASSTIPASSAVDSEPALSTALPTPANTPIMGIDHE